LTCFKVKIAFKTVNLYQALTFLALSEAALVTFIICSL
jgi:hypothetical protein